MSLKYHSKSAAPKFALNENGGNVADAIVALSIAEGRASHSVRAAELPRVLIDGAKISAASAIAFLAPRRVFTNSIRRKKGAAIDGKAFLVNYVANYAGGKIQVNVSNEDTAAAEICIYDEIGEDPWSNIGFSAKDLRNALAQVPRNRDLHIRVNSPGGNVADGFVIKSLLDEWPNKVTVTIDGVAASTASWMILGADEVRAPKASQMFIHDAMTICFGNAADMTAAAADLDKVSDQIAEIYADKTGKSVTVMRNKMRAETLLTGKEAKDLGLIDVLTDDAASYNFTETNLAKMREKLGALKNSAPQGAATENQKPENNIIMKRERMIALLNKWGVTFNNNATDEELMALVEAGKPVVVENKKPAPESPEAARIAELEKTVKNLGELNDREHNDRVEREIDQLIVNDQLTASEREGALKLAKNKETGKDYLNSLRARPVINAGTPPVSRGVELVGEAIKDIQNHILDNGPRFREKFIGAGTGRIVLDKMVMKDIRDRAIIATNTIRKHKDKIVAAWSNNSLAPELQRQVILSDMLEAYQPMILNLNAFSTVYQNIPLEGTDKVEVPYFPRSTAASNSWDSSTGYAAGSFQSWTQGAREIAVGGSGATSGSSAPANTAKDRMWRGILFTGYDFSRQPYLNTSKLFQQEGAQLGIDVFTAIVSRVITSGNFGASVKAVPAAAFAADDIADLRTSATGANWPLMGRSLAIDHTYWGNAIKDPTLKQYLSSGTTDVITWGKMNNVYGFENIFEVPNLSSYSPANQNLVGWTNHKSAVLCATAQIMPPPSVRQLLLAWDLVVDPKTGASFCYRLGGDTTLDQQREIIECSFGAEVGVETALQRITSQ